MQNQIQNWPTRSAAARRLGVTPKRLSDLERAGEVGSVSDFHGRARFDPTALDRKRREIEAAGRGKLTSDRRRPPSGAVCARIFRMFDERTELRRIVVETEQPPDVVQALRRQHADMGRDLLISPRGLVELRELLDWQGDTERTLIGAISARMRYQFEAGQRLERETPSGKHKTKGGASGEIDETESGDASENRPNARDGAGPVRGFAGGRRA